MATITEDYCSKELSLLLDKKGFDGYSTPYSKLILGGLIPHSVAMKWLREIHYIAIVVTPSIFWEKYNVIMYRKGTDYPIGFDGDSLFPSYEHACEAAIKYCLENLI